MPPSRHARTGLCHAFDLLLPPYRTTTHHETEQRALPLFDFIMMNYARVPFALSERKTLGRQPMNYFARERIT